jgi:hypothetical protein
MANGTTTSADLCRQWAEAQATLEAVQRQTLSIQRSALDELCRRDPIASCAFLCAQARGESPKMKDYFKE